MAVITKIEPIDVWVKATVDDHLSPSARSKTIATFAREQIAAAEAANHLAFGHPSRKKVLVDGQEGAELESVKPVRGVITAEFDLVAHVLRWIMETLRDRSPVVSGTYRDNHLLFADGQEVSSGADIPAASEYVILNPLPYARRIEIGRTKSGRDFVIQVPNRIYERTEQDATARFGNIAQLRFEYKAPIGDHILHYQAAGTPRAALSRRGGIERAKRAPAITVRAR